MTRPKRQRAPSREFYDGGIWLVLAYLAGLGAGFGIAVILGS
jgi:hypothetical protein